MNPPANVRRHFLPWDRPLLPQAAAWLADGWAGGAPLDLSRTLVIVPTQQSARRLREALAEHAAAHGQAAFPPRVLTPETLVKLNAPADTATKLESLLVWAEVLRAIALEEFRDVFPVDPPARNATWALRLAQQLAKLQSTLAETGLRIGDVTEKAGDNFSETARWAQLGELETRFDAELTARGLRDAQAVKIAAANQTEEATRDFEKIVLLATPDPLPLALQWLASRGQTVDAVVFAPPTEAENFDDWGRPLPAAWARRELALADFSQRVHLCADPAAQAEMLAAAARSYGAPDGLLALGVGDPEVLPLLDSELARAGVVAFNPEGKLRSADALHHLLVALSTLAHEPTFEAVAALARCPDFLEFLHAKLGGGFSAARFLAELDDLRTQHLPADLAAASVQLDSPALHLMAHVCDALASGKFPANIAGVLGEIFSSRKLDLAREADAQLSESARTWTAVLRECATAQERFSGLGHEDWWEIALRQFGETRRAEEKPAGALELQGWLELLFEDAPHLAVAGLNDGRVPDAVVGDAFLPESLRAALGLKTNATRFARDAYLLQAIAACRAKAGRLDLLFGKTSSSGEPLRPSRLLLQCAEQDLPARVEFLFRAPPLAQANPPWTRAWQLAPRREPPPEKISVTALKGWLACPFRFYLRHVLKMAAVDAAKTELDAMDFGSLCHGALEAMGREAALRDCEDAAVLREFLHAQLAREVRERFGENLTLPLVIQLESARQRLAVAAAVQARERAAGWVIVDVERKFELEISGLHVRGKIDRIDRHAESGAVRLLDYKTSDSAVAPMEAHLRSLKNDEAPPEWMIVVVDGKARAWKDLQLPVYERAVAAEFGGAVTCGYFNLPKAAGETDIALWPEFSAELRESASRCAEGVSAAIRAGEFWPPAELAGRAAERDEFAEIFFHGAAESVAWTEGAR